MAEVDVILGYVNILARLEPQIIQDIRQIVQRHFPDAQFTSFAEFQDFLRTLDDEQRNTIINETIYFFNRRIRYNVEAVNNQLRQLHRNLSIQRNNIPYEDITRLYVETVRQINTAIPITTSFDIAQEQVMQNFTSIQKAFFLYLFMSQIRSRHNISVYQSLFNFTARRTLINQFQGSRPEVNLGECKLVHSSDSTPSNQTRRDQVAFGEINDAFGLLCNTDVAYLFGLNQINYTLPSNITAFLNDPEEYVFDVKTAQAAFATYAGECVVGEDRNLVFRPNDIIIPLAELFQFSDFTQFYKTPNGNQSIGEMMDILYKFTNIQYRMNPILTRTLRTLYRDLNELLTETNLSHLPDTELLDRLNTGEPCRRFQNVPILLAQIFKLLALINSREVSTTFTVPNDDFFADPGSTSLKRIIERYVMFFAQYQLNQEATGLRLIPDPPTNAYFRFILEGILPNKIIVSDNIIPLEQPNVRFIENVGLVSLRNICHGDVLVLEPNQENVYLPINVFLGERRSRRAQIASIPPQIRSEPTFDAKRSYTPEIARITNLPTGLGGCSGIPIRYEFLEKRVL